ncbi:hypothetical protein ABZ912_54015 [Nonomuraea angiospora]|uniref:hypothetical protein n=1 Tax=Nonomuraea angiospora TaxID=46172 RepID=UPI0034079DFF
MQEPLSSEPWRQWHSGLELDRSWPSPASGIDVNRAELKKRAARIVTDDLSSKAPINDEMYSPLSGECTPGAAFGHYVSEVVWGAYSGQSVEKIDLDGAWASADRMQEALNRKFENLRDQLETFFRSYAGFGQLVYAAALNYDAAEGIFNRQMGKLRNIVNGQQDPGRSRPPSDIERWHEEDVSANNAAGVRKFFERSRPRLLLDLGVVCQNSADWMANLAATIEGHSEALAKVWGSQAAELCQQALKKLHGTTKTLAYDAGRTGDVLLSFGELYWRYKENCASAVGDFEVDDLWEWAGGEDNEDDERARQYLREFNQQMGLWYNMIPADAEMLLPQIEYVEALDPKESGIEILKRQLREPYPYVG